MVVRFSSLSWLCLGVVLLGSLLPARLVAGIKRCETDVLATTELAQGRNAWARRCGYITTFQEQQANSLEMYWTFSEGQQPAALNAQCQVGLQLQGLCPKGCFSPLQKVLFDGRYLPISTAYGKETTVTGLDVDLHFTEVAIMDFVFGETQENLLVFTLEGGTTLEVTSKHPLVRASGEVVPADTIKEGEALLNEHFEAATILQIKDQPYQGQVWNILTQSELRQNNLLVSQGLITGSIRFQNQWAEEEFRLFLRDSLGAP